MMFNQEIISAMREVVIKLQTVMDYNCHMGYVD
jgi:hypothetical protein